MKPFVTFAAQVVTATPSFAHIVPFLVWIKLADVQLRAPISPASRCTVTARAPTAKLAVFGIRVAVDHVV